MNSNGYILLIGSAEPEINPSNNPENFKEAVWNSVELAKSIFEPLKFRIILKYPVVTKKNILDEIYSISNVLQKGDFFVFYYIGHGDRRIDAKPINNLSGFDTIYYLTADDENMDGILIDDEISSVWNNFGEGIRTLSIYDCCNAGDDNLSPLIPKETYTNTDYKCSSLTIGASPINLSALVLEDKIRNERNFLFTRYLTDIWNNVKLIENYPQLIDLINNSYLSNGWSPLYTTFTKHRNADKNYPGFVEQRPFQINI